MSCHEISQTEPVDLRHLEECPACAVRYERRQQLAAGMKALAAESRRLGAPARVERRLVAAFRAQTVPGPAPAGYWWMPAVAWGAALAATVLLGLALVRGHQPQRSHRVTRSTIELAAVESGEPMDPIASLADIDGEFIPLPNAESLSPNEALNLVRVEVPRSAMIPLGYAVTEEHASETVEADVVLGADGVARAIRFLNEQSYY